MLKRLFVHHPAAVGESYAEHFLVATRFGVQMIVGGLGAIVHGIVPAWCERTGSTTVKRLYAKVGGRADHPHDFCI